jgi:Tol biopolymer transport system component
MGVNFAGKWEIFVVPTNGGQIRPVFKASQAEGYPDWSPDGEHLVFSEVVPVAQPNGVHILDLRTNRTTTLPGSRDFYLPRWSPDGRFLVALHTDDQYLYLYDFGAATWQPLAKMPSGYPNWSRDSKNVYFVSNAAGRRTVFRVNMADRMVEKVAYLDSIEPSPSILGDWVGLAPDGAPLTVEDMTTDDIYAWDLSVK